MDNPNLGVQDLTKGKTKWNIKGRKHPDAFGLADRPLQPGTSAESQGVLGRKNLALFSRPSRDQAEIFRPGDSCGNQMDGTFTEQNFCPLARQDRPMGQKVEPGGNDVKVGIVANLRGKLRGQAPSHLGKPKTARPSTACCGTHPVEPNRKAPSNRGSLNDPNLEATTSFRNGKIIFPITISQNPDVVFQVNEGLHYFKMDGQKIQICG